MFLEAYENEDSSQAVYFLKLEINAIVPKKFLRNMLPSDKIAQEQRLPTTSATIERKRRSNQPWSRIFLKRWSLLGISNAWGYPPQYHVIGHSVHGDRINTYL